jgi:UDP-glucose 4-epimerase
MNWLITGGCGFLGRNLVGTLVTTSESHAIRVIDNESVGSINDLENVAPVCSVDINTTSSWQDDCIQFIHGDIMDEQLAMAVCAGADVIVHLAANTGVAPSVENPRADCQTNVIGTLNYLEAARGNDVMRFVFASSGAPVGECDPPIHEELPAHPVSPYGASKLAGEGYCSAYKRTFGIDTVALRFGNVYGPGSGHKSSVVAKFIRRAMQGQPLEIYGDGSQTRDFIYVDDLIKAVLLAATRDNVGGEIFQIATNTETTVGDIAMRLQALLKRNGINNFVVTHAEARLGDVKRNFSDISKAENILGWKPDYSLDDGLRKTIDWFMQQ